MLFLDLVSLGASNIWDCDSYIQLLLSLDVDGINQQINLCLQKKGY